MFHILMIYDEQNNFRGKYIPRRPLSMYKTMKMQLAWKCVVCIDESQLEQNGPHLVMTFENVFFQRLVFVLIHMILLLKIQLTLFQEMACLCHILTHVIYSIDIII